VFTTSLDSSFNNMQEWKEIWEKVWGIKSRKVYVTINGYFPLISQWVSQQ
jgi:hypothetical protein